jgi:hypothetical protein
VATAQRERQVTLPLRVDGNSVQTFLLATSLGAGDQQPWLQPPRDGRSGIRASIHWNEQDPPQASADTPIRSDAAAVYASALETTLNTR